MSRSFRLDHRTWLAGFGCALFACSLDSDVPVPSAASATPINSAATVSGPEGQSDAGIGSGDDSVIADWGGASSEATAIARDAGAGGTDSEGAPSESVGGIGGATSSKGGAAGAGGNAGQGGSAGTAGASANVPPPTLLFSEYVEGSSSNKALEITARKDSVLDGCKVGAYFNGSSAASVIATLSGSLAAGQTLTLCTSTLKEKLDAVCSQVGRLTFNGNDAVALSCEGKLLDVIGQIGIDPGTAWGTGTSTTLDHTLRRKCSVTAGDSNGLDKFEPSGEWQALPADTFSGLGSRGC